VRRAVELLEAIRTPQARELIRRLAEDNSTPLAKDCSEALKRLESQ